MSASRVLTTLELVILLERHMVKRDLFALAQTSRKSFQVTIGLLWREVRGVHHLLTLIPGAECKKGQNVFSIALSIPDLDTADLSRLKYYANSVLDLHILPSPYSKYRFSDWSKLFEYSKQGAITPNLRSIAFECADTTDNEFLRWIKPFLSANIQTIRTHSPIWGFYSQISDQQSRWLLRKIAKHSPAVRDLSFFPVDPYFGGRNASDSGEDYSQIDAQLVLPVEAGTEEYGPRPIAFHEYLRLIPYLQSLTTTSFIINTRGLEVLASMPNLGKLVLHCMHFNETMVYEFSPKYPENAFPCLRSLELVLPDMDCVSQIWSHEALVYRLTEVTVRLGVSNIDSDEDWAEDDESAHIRSFEGFIPEMCKLSPSIQKLTIDFDATQGDTIAGIAPEILQHLIQLPLQTLDLRHAFLNDCMILKQCHSLRNLHLQDQVLSYKTLLPFSQIPGLERFHARMRWDGTPDTARWLSRPDIKRFSDLRFLQCSDIAHFVNTTNDKLGIENAARFLHAFFPKLEEVSWVGTSMYGVSPGTQDFQYTFLSEMVKGLRSGHTFGL